MSKGALFIEMRREPDPEERERTTAQEEASTLFALARAKEILTDLERQSRITTGLREQGIVALSAAILATEHPYMRNLGTQAGLRASTEQYEAAQKEKNRAF